MTVPAAQSSEEAPVEIERLLDFTEGDDENLRELVTLYLEQTNGQIEQMEAAVQAGNAGEVRRIAHSCAGASATCGMRYIVPALRELERLGMEGQLAGAADLCDTANREFIRIREFLNGYMASRRELASKSCP